MPALKCPSCGYSDLHAVDVESVKIDCDSEEMLRQVISKELGCKRCGWTPTHSSKPQKVLAVSPADNNT